jgi:uncharacterized repeat protein (TIGR02543 family)
MKKIKLLITAVITTATIIGMALNYTACKLGEPIELPAYTVTYNANGGGGTMDNSRHVYSKAKNLSANAFTREGYTFAGWAESPSGAVKYTNGQSVKNLTKKDGASVTLYAVWAGHNYTVVFNANGGGGEMDNSGFTYGVSRNLPENSFTRTGYVFTGWATSASGEVVYMNEQGVSNLTTTAGATITLYAVWSINFYTVVYDRNGGSGTMPDSVIIIGEEFRFRENTFTNPGYGFAGWAASDSGAVVYTDGHEVRDLSRTAGDTVTLYAVWAPAYTVVYNPNGGTGTMPNSVIIIGASQNLRLNTFTRTGYVFTGWATSSSGTAVYTDGQSVSNLATVVETVTLYAVWIANTYTVVYNANGGSGTMEDSVITVGQSQQLRTNTFARTGYTFAGWATTTSGTAAYTNGQSVSNLTTAGNTVTLYAVWNGISYTVAYNNNGGSGTMANTGFTYGTEQNLRANTFTRSGYVFAGWAATASGAVVYTDGQSVSDLTTVAGSTVTLYAIWNRGYTVAYNANGGSGTMASSTFISGQSQNLRINTITRTNYVFIGWATTSTGTVVYEDGQNVTDLTTVAGATVTLYAVWGTNFYTVVYDPNGGGGTMVNTVIALGNSQNLRTNAFTRTGYTFAGWAASATGTAEYTDEQSVSDLASTAGATVTLYAVWTGISYTVVYNANNGSGSMEGSGFTYGTEQNLRANTFTCTGYGFAGWATTASGAVVYTDGQSVGNLTTAASATVTLYAVWNTLYTVAYNANGGDGSMANTGFTYGVSQNLQANTFTRTGYGFAGWATSAVGPVVYADQQSVSNLTSTAGATVTLYAVWAGISYTVVYHANGAAGTMADTVFTYGVSQNLRENTFKFPGYGFAGWAETISGQVVYTDGQSVSDLTTVVGAGITLYAVWAPAYTVVYNANSGSGTMVNSDIILGVSGNLRTNTFTRTGYTFTGWATSASGTVVYTDGQSVLDLATTSGVTVNLYAVWAANTYTVVYHPNTGGGSMENSSYTYGVSQNLRANTFFNPDYGFVGWATSATGTVVYTNGQSVSNLATEAGTTVTLYVVWAPAYTVVYDANGGNGNMENTGFTYGVSQNLRTNTFTRTGYGFAGWATSATGTVLYTNGQSVTNLATTAGATVTLYAVWYLRVSGSDLAAKLAWLQTNALSNTNYIVEVEANESIGPNNLSYSSRTNIGITLIGTGAVRTVSLSSNGTLFTVQDGVTLTLDNNITLQGRTSNNASLVRVNSGGTLVMNTGSRITGNRFTNSSYYGGGVDVAGRFTMNGGEISGNHATDRGGGVNVDGNNAIFTMRGGVISGNSTSFNGGGVYVFRGTFTMITGTIYGSNETTTSLRNTTTNSLGEGAAFDMSTGYGARAQRGYSNGSTWVSTGNITKTNNTIKVVNGVLTN